LLCSWRELIANTFVYDAVVDEFIDVELSLHGSVPDSGYEDSIREIADALVRRLPGASYTAGLLDQNIEQLLREGYRGSSKGRSTTSKISRVISPERVVKMLQFDEAGGDIDVSLGDFDWRAHVGALRVDFLDFRRFDAKVVIVVPSSSLRLFPLSAVEELVAFGAEAASRVHIWNGWVSAGANWLEIINGFDWYERYARDAVSSYPWSVFVSAGARPKLDLSVIDSLECGVTITEIAASASAGAALFTAGQSPAVMSPRDLKQWRALFLPAMSPVINPAAHDDWVGRDDFDRPAGIVPEDWTILFQPT
jgi:hypothetical protein